MEKEHYIRHHFNSSAWTVKTNNGTNVTAYNSQTNEEFNGTLEAFNNKFKQKPSIEGSTTLFGTRDATFADDGLLLTNTTANSMVVTVQKGMPINFGFGLIQASTGSCKIEAGAGVTILGTTPVATSTIGSILALIYIDTDTYIIKGS